MHKVLHLLFVLAIASLGCSDQGLTQTPEEPEEPEPTFPSVEVSPMTVEFGMLEVGTELSQMVTITSVGDASLELQDLYIAGPSHFSFSFDEELPLVLLPEESTTAQVSFAALDGNEQHGEFNVVSSDPVKQTVTVALHGAGIGPAITIQPDSWDFGAHGINCTETVDLSVMSTGAMPVTIDTWAFESFPSTTAMTWSTQDLYEGLELLPGEEAVITITFTAEDLGTYQGELTVFPVEDIVEATAAQTAEGEGGDWVVDEFLQEGNFDTDILWVVDNSCSMYEEQTTLGDDFISFYGIVDAQGVDYRIAVVTTDDENFQGATKVIDPSTANGEQAFANNCDLGTNGSGTERGLQYGWEAMEKAVLNQSPNHDFYRSNAGLRVVFVSDENDQSGSWSTYVSYYQGLKLNPNHVILSAIVGTDGQNAQSCNGAGGDADAGTGYVDAVTATGGILASICDSDWSTALTSMGWQSLSLADTLALSEEPIPSTITVEVNGVGLSQGWYYDSVINAVILEPDYVPEDGDIIHVTYQTVGDCGG
jgi:hypothetical protein